MDDNTPVLPRKAGAPTLGETPEESNAQLAEDDEPMSDEEYRHYLVSMALAALDMPRENEAEKQRNEFGGVTKLTNETSTQDETPATPPPPPPSEDFVDFGDDFGKINKR